MRFDCPRTCPAHERHDLCRFTPVLTGIGVNAQVTSHTTRVAVEYRDLEALAEAVAAMGGTVIGHGTHTLYERGAITGYAVRLRGWTYPLVIASGELFYDNYGGRWGNPADLARLQREYTLAAAARAAAAQGWIHERAGDRVVIYHPGGGTLTVSSDGTCDAAGFVGAACHETSIIEQAIGRPIACDLKPEYYDQPIALRLEDL